MKLMLFAFLFFTLMFIDSMVLCNKNLNSFLCFNKGVQTANALSLQEAKTSTTCNDCTTVSFKSNSLLNIPRGNDLGVGMRRVLTNLYGTCAAKDSLNSLLSIRDGQFHNRYSLAKPGDPLGPGDRFINFPKKGGGFDYDFIKNFDTIRAVNTAKNPLGPYVLAAKGSKECTNEIDVNGEKLKPSKVHKIFGNGASGRIINNEFNIFSCGASNYLSSAKIPNSQERARRRAISCGLEVDSPPAIALDCAEFIGAGAIASCKKLHPEQTVGKEGIRLGKSFLSTSSLSKNTCLKSPVISFKAPISSGDIFVIDGHSIVITDIGNDPFNIAAAKGNCDSINSNDLNFSFAHSSSSRELGPIQTTAQAYSGQEFREGLGLNAFPLGAIVILARKLCKDKENGKTDPGPSDNFIKDSKVRQLRHQGSKPSCVYPKGKCPKSVGSECSKMCGV